ncbi:hypothetical protein [Nocardia beijingensis]
MAAIDPKFREMRRRRARAFAARNAQSIRDFQKPGLADLSQISL